MKMPLLYLSKLRQIGRWSAEMILLFTYNRSNIWPVQDIGLLRAISKNYKKKYLPNERLCKVYYNKRFSPYCSVATWYLWRSIDPRAYSVLNPSIICICLSSSVSLANIPTILIFFRVMALNSFFITWKLPNNRSYKVITIIVSSCFPPLTKWNTTESF